MCYKVVAFKDRWWYVVSELYRNLVPVETYFIWWLGELNVGGNELITPVDWPSRSGNHLPLGSDTLSDICFDWQVVGGSTTTSISGPAFNSVVEYRSFSWNINTFKMTQYIAQDCKANQRKITYLHKVLSVFHRGIGYSIIVDKMPTMSWYYYSSLSYK